MVELGLKYIARKPNLRDLGVKTIAISDINNGSLYSSAPGGDLQKVIDDDNVPFEADVVKFIHHVVEGLAYMHQRKIAHLDIKVSTELFFLHGYRDVPQVPASKIIKKKRF